MGDADIPHSVDPIAHPLLVSLVARRSSDRRVVQRIRPGRQGGGVEQGHGQPTAVGSRPGGVVSPVLANLDWHGLDRYWGTRDAGLGALVRYAADLGMIGRTQRQAAHALHAVRRILQTRTRHLHPTQTRLAGRAQEGFDCLGCHFPKLRAKRTGTWLPYMGPSQQAMKAIRGDLHGLTSRQRVAAGLAAVISQLNPVIAGWRNSCQIGNSAMTRQPLDRSLWHRVRRLGRAKRGSRGHWQEPVVAAWLTGRGLAGFDQPGIGGS